LNPKEYSESVVAENNFVDVTVVLPPAFERSSEAVMGVNDVKPRGVTPSATAYSQQDIERKKLLVSSGDSYLGNRCRINRKNGFAA
jgi:hypothetical protein